MIAPISFVNLEKSSTTVTIQDPFSSRYRLKLVYNQLMAVAFRPLLIP